jgi:hypothetical protein
MIPDEVGRSCKLNLRVSASRALPECGEREVVSDDGQRCEACPVYTRAFNRNTRCEPQDCSFHENEYLADDGTCKACPRGYIRDYNDKKTCVPLHHYYNGIRCTDPK